MFQTKREKKKENEYCYNMGLTLSRLIGRRWFASPEIRVLLRGPDGGGKTSVLYAWKGMTVLATIPTIGFNVETVWYRNIKFTVWDFGGAFRWNNFDQYARCFENTQGIVFVVDAASSGKVMDEARDGLHRMMNRYNDYFRESHTQLLVLCNKQDLDSALSMQEIARKLQLDNLPAYLRGQWHIQACSVQSGDGLYEGFDWLASANMAARRKNTFGLYKCLDWFASALAAVQRRNKSTRIRPSTEATKESIAFTHRDESQQSLV